MTIAYVVDNAANGTYTFSPGLITLSYENVGGMVFQNSKGEIFTCTGASLRSQIDAVNPAQHETVVTLEKMPLKSAEELVKEMQ